MAALNTETNNGNAVVGKDTGVNDFRTVFTGALGAGLTIDVGRSAFIRPQVRTHLAPGPFRTVNVTALPFLGLGWRF